MEPLTFNVQFTEPTTGRDGHGVHRLTTSVRLDEGVGSVPARYMIVDVSELPTSAREALRRGQASLRICFDVTAQVPAMAETDDQPSTAGTSVPLDAAEEARPALVAALLDRAQRYIRANYDDPTLSPGRVAAATKTSRSSLYRAFEPHGGVTECIRRARLDAARAALRNVGDLRRIGEIAFAHGFSSEAQFSRSMRSAFGASPSQLRHRPVPLDDGRSYAQAA